MVITPHFIHFCPYRMVNLNIYNRISFPVFQVLFIYLFYEFFCFLTRMWLCSAKPSRLVRYLVFQLRSLPFLRFFPSCLAGWLHSCIPLEMSCVYTLCFDTNTVVSLYCFSHTMTLLRFRNMDISLLLPPFFPPPVFRFFSILPPLFTAFNCSVTLPK